MSGFLFLSLSISLYAPYTTHRHAPACIPSGTYYYEVSMRDEGICRVGWASQAANFDLGKDKHGFGFGGTGKKAHDGKFLDFGEPFTKGDVVGCLLDLPHHRIVFSKNGKAFPPAYTLPSSHTGALFPAFAMKNAELSVNFGGPSSPFKHAPPGACGTSRDFGRRAACGLSPHRVLRGCLVG